MKKGLARAIIYVIFFFVFAYFNYSALSRGTGFSFGATLTDSLNRVFSYENLRYLLKGIGGTLFCLISTLILGSALGYFLFLIHYSENRIGIEIVEFFDNIFFYLPFSTWLLAIFYIVFQGNEKYNLVVAVIALTISFGFHFFEQLERAISALGIDELETALSMGYNRYLAFRKILLPNAFNNFLIQMNDQVVIHVQATSLVGLISVLDVQRVADELVYSANDSFLPMIFTSLVYILLGLCLSRIVMTMKTNIMVHQPEAVIRRRIERGWF